MAQNATVKGVIIDDRGKPLEGAYITLKNQEVASTSNQKGEYSVKVPTDQNFYLVYTFVGHDTVEKKFNLTVGTVYEQNVTLRFSAQDFSEFEFRDKRLDRPSLIAIDPKTVDALPSPNAGVERTLLFQAVGVSSTNELSSQYNVRGGNFDENLVYVNDVAIYRPFLVRSGQQEGLSFVNPYLVESVDFSSGGFQAKYGDKMSSVLDVKYKTPDTRLSGAVEGSLLGTSVFLANSSKNYRFTQIHGFRYRTNQYVLNSLDTDGDYRPAFTDYQGYFTFDVTDDFEIAFLGTYSNNRYQFIPETRQTEFGSVNEALRLTIFFDGQEINQFENYLGAFTASYQPTKNLRLKFITSAWRSLENETYDVEGAYRLDELDRDLGSDNFGDVAANRGIGGFLNHARNYLDAVVATAEHKGTYYAKNATIDWGLKAQREWIQDEFNEWQMIDSAGYSIPQRPTDQIELYSVINADNSIESNRYSGYAQYAREWEIDSHLLNINAGGRFNYWDFNEQLVGGPRISASFVPNWEKKFTFRAAWGYYHQPPFFREMRNLNGEVNQNIKAQTSIHYVAGVDHEFTMWDRPFLFTTEAYYKDLKNLIPYEIDNVRLRYYATNNSSGYATGIDFKLNGEFVKGIESWVSMSIMQTEEDLNNDFYLERFNASGELIVPGFTADQVAVDTAVIRPGAIPRPTDQRFRIALFFQDYFPGNESFRMNLSFIFATGLPFGPPTYNRYEDTLRIPAYRRVDLGISKQLLKDKDDKRSGLGLKKPFHYLENIWLSLEVFNLLQVNNTISYLWIRDVSNRTYAVPNYLTNRQVNLKLQVRF